MTSLVTPSQRLFGVTLTGPLSAAVADRLARLGPGRDAAPQTSGKDAVQAGEQQQRAQLRVRPVAWTHFEAPDDVDWTTDADGGSALSEFAGRACYDSWDKPNPATATNAGYLRHLLDVGHLAALEHASATFYVTGVSRAAAQELTRHRQLSFSQLSPRQVPGPGARVVEPDVVAADPYLHERFAAATGTAAAAYADLLAGLERAADASGPAEASLRRKQARQAARTVLPAAGETRFVVTGNYRAWRHVIGARACEHADVELRSLAVAVLRELRRLAPNAFADFAITALPDGTEVASSPLVADS